MTVFDPYGDPRPTRLWNRDFTIWWLGGLQSSLGSALSGIALSFLVLKQTGSAGAMGVTLALGLLPALLAPLAGTLVDRIPLKAPLILSELLRAAIQLGLGFFALQGTIPLWAINVLALVMGLIGTFHYPATSALLPKLVPEAELPRANGLVGAAQQGASLFGLVGGGILVSRFGSAPSLILDGLSYLIMAGLLLLVRMPVTAASASGQRFWLDLMDGLKVVRASRILMAVPFLSFGINATFAPIDMLLPGRMLQLGAGAAGFGTFFALYSGGMLAGSALAAGLGARLNARFWAGGGLLFLGGGLLLLSTAPSLPAMLAVAFGMGTGVGLGNTAFMTLLQQMVGPAYLGRVFSLLGTAGMLGMPLTLLALAPIADRLPLGSIFAVAGAVTLLGCAVWFGLIRSEPAVRAPIEPMSALEERPGPA